MLYINGGYVFRSRSWPGPETVGTIDEVIAVLVRNGLVVTKEVHEKAIVAAKAHHLHGCEKATDERTT